MSKKDDTSRSSQSEEKNFANIEEELQAAYAELDAVRKHLEDLKVHYTSSLPPEEGSGVPHDALERTEANQGDEVFSREAAQEMSAPGVAQVQELAAYKVSSTEALASSGVPAQAVAQQSEVPAEAGMGNGEFPVQERCASRASMSLDFMSPGSTATKKTPQPPQAYQRIYGTSQENATTQAPMSTTQTNTAPRGAEPKNMASVQQSSPVNYQTPAGAGGQEAVYSSYQQSTQPNYQQQVNPGYQPPVNSDYQQPPNMGYQRPANTSYQQPYYQHYVRPKDHVAAGLLAIFLGCFGAHKFYLGYNTVGFIMLSASVLGSLITLGLSVGVMFVIGVIEGVIYLIHSQSEFEQMYVREKREWF